jgi:hypothetical protein
MKNELERIRKEAAVAYFMVLSRHLPGETEKHEGRRSPGHSLTPSPPEYEAGVLTLDCDSC